PAWLEPPDISGLWPIRPCNLKSKGRQKHPLLFRSVLKPVFCQGLLRLGAPGNDVTGPGIIMPVGVPFYDFMNFFGIRYPQGAEYNGRILLLVLKKNG